MSSKSAGDPKSGAPTGKAFVLGTRRGSPAVVCCACSGMLANSPDWYLPARPASCPGACPFPGCTVPGCTVPGCTVPGCTVPGWPGTAGQPFVVDRHPVARSSVDLAAPLEGRLAANHAVAARPVCPACTVSPRTVSPRTASSLPASAGCSPLEPSRLLRCLPIACLLSVVG